MSSRREFLSTTALGGGFLAAGAPAARAAAANRDAPFRHTVMGWCFQGRGIGAVDLAKWCVKLGMRGMEGIPRAAYKEVMDLGLEISLVGGGHGFAEGPCNPKFHDKVVRGLREAIDLAAGIGSKRVITFTGMRYEGMDDGEAATRCVDWKEVLPLAEKKGITLCFEHLNSRATEGKMTGHPGYFGDDVDFCIDLVKRVGSENFKLLFDIYHVAVMNGDIIRRIREYKDYIGHYHTAGNPGRGEIDDTQEINYPPIIAEIVKTGFTGFIAQEFIPTWDDPFASLRHGVQTCSP